jgi:dihydrofolate reductase
MSKKIILFIASSLDGFIAKKNGDVSWLFTDQDYGFTKFMHSVDSAVMGRKTYDFAAQYSNPPFVKIKNFIVTKNSKLRKSSSDNLIFCSLDEAIKFVKTDKGKKSVFLVGGTGLIAEFINRKLLTEIRVFIHPVLLGDGIPLFKGIRKEVNLKFAESKSFSSGLLEVRYRVYS